VNEERKRREGKEEVERRWKRQRRICDWVEAMRVLTRGGRRVLWMAGKHLGTEKKETVYVAKLLIK
jgi:hypothetical protein